MPANASLHRALRKVADFRVLSGKDLDTIIDQMSFKEYKAGDVLWRTSTHLNFLGIVQNGEIIVERQINGKVVRSIKLFAGDVVQPQDFRAGSGHSSTLARAVTDVKFYALRMDQANRSQGRQKGGMIRTSRSPNALQQFILSITWVTVICLTILIINLRDINRILSGLLYFESERTMQPVPDLQRSVKLLIYAESIDQDAAFAHNQEGLLWYQWNDLQNAMGAFTRAVNIDQANGSGFNNLAVTYFTFGQIQRAATSQKQAAQNAPNSAITHYNLGLVLMKQNEYSEAVHEFREAMIIEPNWVLPYIQQGFDYIQLQNYTNAEKAATTAIKLDPNQQSAYVILAISLYNQGRDEDALKSIDAALQLKPSDHVARFYKALTLKRLGKFGPALGILDQLLISTIDPGQVSRINSEIESIHRILQDHQVGV